MGRFTMFPLRAGTIVRTSSFADPTRALASRATLWRGSGDAKSGWQFGKTPYSAGYFSNGVISNRVQGVDVMHNVKNNNLVFEIGLSFTVMHYQAIVPAAMRTLFQAFRPLLILFIFGQILKSVFFLAGTPIWFSFYSVWMFEVGYGLFQCVLSFLFIAFFYNNLSFARVRPVMSRIINQQREKLRM